MTTTYLYTAESSLILASENPKITIRKPKEKRG